MPTLDIIRQPIACELEDFDRFVAKEFESANPLVKTMLDDALSSRGKAIRPIIVMLCAGLNSPTGIIGRRAWIAAMMVEMIHVASLIHDDVIDESMARRGRPSLNAKWQSKRAVLIGDYILARNINLALSSGQFDLSTHIFKAIAQLCEGEIIQDDCARRHSVTREEYLSIIGKKTASLISISASAGAMSAGADSRKIDLMRRFGEAIGMAFQIQDDILDYCPHAKTGKPSFNDLREGKITLPLLTVMEKATDDERAKISELLNKCAQDEEAISEIAHIVEQQDGVAFAQEVMNAYIMRATEILAEYPEGEFRTALANLCAFITQRDR